MRLLSSILRSMMGMLVFNLPMRCIPHYTSATSLVATLVVVYALLQQIVGSHLIDLLMSVAIALYLLAFRPKRGEKPKPSIQVAIFYIMIVSDFVAMVALTLLSNPESDKWLVLLVRLWQIVVITVYTCILLGHHKKLAESSAGSSA